jgi:dolichol-phosphate mannosyltransferase
MSGERPRVTIVIPAYNEDEHIVPILDRLFESVRLSCEVLVVVDTPDDTTIPVVTMADGCDDARQIDELARLVERGVAVAAASRYMAGGQQVGGPVLKGSMSRMAGRSLRMLAHVGTRDATNSFKAYATDFVREVGIDSRDGFEIGIELTAKAKRLGRPVAEIPTIWLDRQAGVSNFRVAKWIPSYLRWYRFAFGPRLTADELRTRAAVPPSSEETRGK